MDGAKNVEFNEESVNKPNMVNDEKSGSNAFFKLNSSDHLYIKLIFIFRFRCSRNA